MVQSAEYSYDIERSSVRVVLLDERDSVLLLLTQDPVNPQVGRWWELPGGGIDPGETTAATAVREVREETGFEIAITAIRAPNWSRSATFVRGHDRTLQHEVVVLARVAGVAPAPTGSGRTVEEQAAILDHRWWPIADLISTTDRCYPGRLPELIEDFLTGVEIDEPFEVWS